MKPEEQAEKTYADILLLPYPKSKRPTYLSLRERAAQFAPFAALAGYEEMVQEEARLTEPEKELSEWELQLLDGTLHQMEEQMKEGRKPQVRVDYFVRDLRKPGGSRETAEGMVKEMDPVFRRLILFEKGGTDLLVLPFSDILNMEILSEG